ncbi:carbohydrate ABC transporter permease [Herbiconiux sp. A18JL235]|uniref:Carbohydrate ABC transporter permease n=1 Tax=Herbiconiux sp. A18JL235 TaxID=3152363 RepID=A0AB39BG56_9MICO
MTSPRLTLRSQRTSHQSPPSTILRYFLLIAAAAYFIGPLLWLFMAASKSSGAVIGTPAWSFEGFQLFQNLQELFSYDGGIFFRWIANSALYAIAGAFVGTLIAAMGGYYISMFRFRGRDAIFAIVLGGVLVPATALALPLFLLFAQVNLTDTFWAVFLPSLVSPFGFYLSRLTADSAVPLEVVESARVDGAGEIRIFFSIASRLMLPGLVTVFLVQFVGIWNNFLLPVVMLNNSDLYPLTLGLYIWNGQVQQASILQTLTLTGSLVSIIPLTIAFIALQRFWQSGLNAGAVKA